MQTIFKKGYQKQVIRAVPADEKENKGWNSFSCSLDEVDRIRNKYKNKRTIHSDAAPKEQFL